LPGPIIFVYDEGKFVKQEHLDVMYDLFTCSKFFKEGGTCKGYSVQISLFKFYDFEVIPVELISNIYENFLDNSETLDIENKNLQELPKSKQKEIKAFYTPPFLVDYVLSQTVIPHLEKQETASCKILDPACGSGIFLVETLRKIIEKETQVNPGTIPDDRLWELVRENIFGIDMDSDAIEITIFSIYITILDYKTPIEIKSCHFERLKEKNLFAGRSADFFRKDHLFNDIFKNRIHLDFIIGNPPWGVVKESRYEEYIKNRNKKEKKENPGKHIKLEIGRNEISQAFMVRISDFVSPGKKIYCVLVVTGKNLYNKMAKTWRNYFLNKFHINQILELSSVNNKIVSGKQIFESAKQSAVVISYYPAENREDTSKNLIRHITARPNRFFNYFKTIVIEKNDVKKVLQKYFIESKGGYDWLWKILLHGNFLDFLFIKRLKDEKNFETLVQLMEKHDLVHKGGLKLKDKHIKPEKRKSTKLIED
jgi:methylase of polypeptide subunit release factors